MPSCLLYAGSVLGLTAGWVVLGRNWSFQSLAKAMFFPTLLLPLFVSNYLEFLIMISGTREITTTLLYSLLAVVLVYAIVYSCVGFDLALSWATKVPQRNSSTAIHEHNADIIWGFMRAAGEEVGWRCFLLPCLFTEYTPLTAFTISGIVWGLFHVPVMILLTYKLKVPKPVVTVTVQSLSCAMMAVPIGWLTIKSKYSMLPASIMHCVWNRVNPRVLGSIYTQTPGDYQGEQWKINGEGLAGCIVMLPVAFLCLYSLY